MTAPRRRLITVDEVHAMTTLSPSTLYDWAAKGKGPKTFRLGGRRVYDEASVLEWIADQERAAVEGDGSVAS